MGVRVFFNQVRFYFAAACAGAGSCFFAFVYAGGFGCYRPLAPDVGAIALINYISPFIPQVYAIAGRNRKHSEEEASKNAHPPPSAGYGGAFSYGAGREKRFQIKLDKVI